MPDGPRCDPFGAQPLRVFVPASHRYRGASSVKSIWSQGYVYRPWSEERRVKMRSIHKARLGIPDGHVQIYGVFVPQEMEDPLRYYASWVNQRRGRDAAEAFVLSAVAAGKSAKPMQRKFRRCERGYIYRPWPGTINRTIARLSRKLPPPEKGAVVYGIPVPRDSAKTVRAAARSAFERGGERAAQWVVCEAWKAGWPSQVTAPSAKVIDWELVDILLSEHAALDEVAAFLEVGVPYLKRKLKERSL